MFESFSKGCLGLFFCSMFENVSVRCLAVFSSVMFGGVFPWVVSERFTVGCLEISLWDV